MQQTLHTASGIHLPEQSTVRITLAGRIIAFLLISLILELIRRSINKSLKNGTREPFIWLDVLGLKIMTRKQFRRPLEWALQALLLPSGGYGGVQFIEYMMSFTLST